jgi:hypothetical protein
MKTKYQVFVSSTFEDLKHERDQVLKAILEMGHIPVGMELFSAGDEQQWELIKRQIDDSDYYIVVIAHRYGSRDGSVSFTEKEYDYAVSRKVPALGFIIGEDAPWPKSSIDDGVDQEALQRFKEKVKKKIVSFWGSREDLHAKVSISLGKAITAYPRAGWVRATASVGPEVMTELSRLSKENAELRSSLATETTGTREKREEDDRRVLDLLSANKISVGLGYQGERDWRNVDGVSLHRLFRLLAPELMVEKSVKASATFLAWMLRPADMQDKTLREPWPIGYNQVRALFADLHALGLIEPSIKKHHIKDEEDYWTLTEAGKRIYSTIRVDFLQRQLNEVLSAKNLVQEEVPEPATETLGPPKKKSRKKARKR